MSFRRPKARYKRRRVVQSSSAPLESTPPAVFDDSLSQPGGTSTTGTLISVSEAPNQKRPRHSKDLFLPGPEGLITLPGGLTLTQTTVTNAFDDRVRDSEGQRRCSSSETSDDDTNYASANHIGSLNNLHSPTKGGDEPRRRQRKKASVSAKWTTDIIPSLIPIYLRLHRETESFRLNPTNPVSTACSCTSSRPLTVACLFFQRKPALNIVFLLCF
jgi:hypothetical protein